MVTGSPADCVFSLPHTRTSPPGLLSLTAGKASPTKQLIEMFSLIENKTMEACPFPVFHSTASLHSWNKLVGPRSWPPCLSFNVPSWHCLTCSLPACCNDHLSVLYFPKVMPSDLSMPLLFMYSSVLVWPLWRSLRWVTRLPYPTSHHIFPPHSASGCLLPPTTAL